MTRIKLPIEAAASPDLPALWRRNRALLAQDHQAGRAVVSGRPAHLKIELTNFCNLACPLCPHRQMQREVGYMRPALFRKIIDDAAPELEFAYLHHLGESLFHGHLPELIRYGRQRGVRLGLSTNATFLTARKGRALIDSGLDFLVISLDGASEDTYRLLRVGGDFRTTVSNVRAFLQLKRDLRRGPQVVLQMILTEHNRHEIEPFARLWDGQVVIKEARDWAGQVPLELVPLSQRHAHAPCRMPWTELTVLWDGAVVPCANVFERHNLLGDLCRQSLDEVWNGPALRALRAAHAADQVGTVPVCATCPRHALDPQDFVAVDQLAQRLRNYIDTDLTPRPGLS